MVIILGGCGSSPIDPLDAEFLGDLPPLNPDLPAEEITLEVWLDLDFVRPSPLFLEMAQEFEAAYPQVTVNIQPFVPETIPAKLNRAIQTGNSPDVVQGHVYAMAARGMAQPIDGFWQAWGVEDQFIPAALEEVTWRGQKYGVPLDIYTLVLLFNKSHFDEAGLPYPDAGYTWLQLVEDAATLTSGDGARYGLGFTADPWHVSAWLSEAGGYLVRGDALSGFTLTLDDPNNIAALDFLRMLSYKQGYGPLPTTRPRDYEDPRKFFLDDQISMYFGGPWDIHYIQVADPDFPLGVTQLPQTPAGVEAASALGSTGLFVPTGARHREVALEFIKWATSDRYGLPMARRLGRYPARTWLQTTPYFAGNARLKPFLNQLDAARPYHLDAFPEIERHFADAVKKTFYGANAEDALKEAQQLSLPLMEETP
ncbi:MAG: extracellular solute-binding protein [Anaerolineae bacterium]